jgi:hypothetical protein
MFRPNARNGDPRFFSSAKTAAPVPARHPAIREALVVASLDPSVRAISHVETAPAGPAQVVGVDAVVLTRADGRFYLDVVAARRVRDGSQNRTFTSSLHSRPFLRTCWLRRRTADWHEMESNLHHRPSAITHSVVAGSLVSLGMIEADGTWLISAKALAGTAALSAR